MNTSWKFDILTSWDDVLSDRFWAQWDAWYRAAASRHIFFSPVLAKVWLDTYLPIRNLRPLYVVARAEAATIFLPLVLWRKNWKNACHRVIVPVGDSDYDYHDPLVVGDPTSVDWMGFWTHVSSLLNRHADVISIDGLHSHCASPENPHTLASDGAPFLDLGGMHSGKDYLATRSRNVRNDFPRRLRRLEERGSLSHRVFGRSDIDSALTATAVAIEHHRKRWPFAYKAPRFYERLIVAALPVGALLLSCLEVEGAQIAWEFCFIDGPVLRHYMLAHDQAWRSYGVANIVRFRNVEHAIQCGLTRCDFLRGTEEYKSVWSSSVAPLYRFEERSSRAASKGRNWIVNTIRPRFRL